MDERIGKYYYCSGFRDMKPTIFKIHDVYYDDSYHANVFLAYDEHGKEIKERTIMLGYYREATPTEILLYYARK